ncbi:hypothetical protein OP10G_3904 [Fimbriimonas ginsengisoli Gsoil 348]|uniref:Uncharacterized protein n=1 Tax=Fimbriimonas ginsengisoli Gsoil 348 TaxID=661478 RepID=A0A068NV74_FIMGI|nr:hypothetical protein OP10G_3904 [Fimbriimonas ginsengisoli Gsoil 348]
MRIARGRHSRIVVDADKTAGIVPIRPGIAAGADYAPWLLSLIFRYRL